MKISTRNSYVCSPVPAQNYDIYPSTSNLWIKKRYTLDVGQIYDIARYIVDHFKWGDHENEDFEVVRGSFFVQSHHYTEWESADGGDTYMGIAEPYAECTRDEIEIVDVYNDRTDRSYPTYAARIAEAVKMLRKY